MESTRIRLLLKTISQESATLRLLSYDTKQLMKQFGLSEAELEALRNVDLLRASELSGRRSPALPHVQMSDPQATGTMAINMYDGLMPSLQAMGVPTTASVNSLTPQGTLTVNMYDSFHDLTRPQLASNGNHPDNQPIEDPLA